MALTKLLPSTPRTRVSLSSNKLFKLASTTRSPHTADRPLACPLPSAPQTAMCATGRCRPLPPQRQPFCGRDANCLSSLHNLAPLSFFFFPLFLFFPFFPFFPFFSFFPFFLFSFFLFSFFSFFFSFFTFFHFFLFFPASPLFFLFFFFFFSHLCSLFCVHCSLFFVLFFSLFVPLQVPLSTRFYSIKKKRFSKKVARPSPCSRRTRASLPTPSCFSERFPLPPSDVAQKT